MRKHILLGILLPLLFILFCQTNLHAQTNNWDTLPWRTYADYKFQPLNKNLIPTGVLYDRVFPIANVERYTGGPALTDTTNSNHFLQAYYEMYQASYNTSGKKRPEELDSLLKKNYTANEHPIGIMLYKFNRFDSLALQDHLLDTLPNGQFVDVSNPPRNPYVTSTSFMASAMIAEGQNFTTGAHKFYIDPAFFVTNEQLTLKTVKIDFGDGQGWQTIEVDGNLQQRSPFFFFLAINSPFMVLARIEIIFLSPALQGISYKGIFQISVKPAKDPFIPTPCKGQNYWIVDANQAALNQVNATYNNPPIDHEGRKDSAFFFYAGNGTTCGNTIRRPVIILDAFDPTNDRDMGTIWNEKINIRIDRNGNPNTKFGDYMLNEGYDIIVLNFKNGNDLIERDALTLVALIERLNQTYGSQYLQDITVMGPSSGGLVVQYALAYMEHNNIPHRVKTFVAFDTQFQGANFPIGLQYFFQYVSARGILFAINKTRTLLSDGLYNSYVNKQMLAHHHSANSITPAPHPYRNQFLANLAAVGGYPQQCRKVAIINGVNTGAPNNAITANSTMLSISAKRGGPAGACNNNICKKLNWVCKSTTNGAPTNVTQMYTAIPALNLLLLQPPITKNYSAGPAWNNSSLDNAPGSTFVNIFGNNPGEINEDKLFFLLQQAIFLLTGQKNTTFTQQINRFTLIPSYHAADLQYPNKNLYLNWSNEYLCGKTPLDYVYVPNNIQFHAERNNANLQFFENEIKCNVLTLPTFIGELTIPPAVCSTATAEVQQCKTNMNYTYAWSSSNPTILQITGTGRQVTLTKIGNGTVTVSVTITGCGVNITRSKQVAVGGPEMPFVSPSNFDAQCGTFAEAYSTIPATTTGHVWNLNYGMFVEDKNGYGSNYFYTAPLVNTPQTGLVYYNYLSVQAKNACGLSDPSPTIAMTVGPVPSNCGSGGGGGPMLRVTMSPVPTGNQLNVAVNVQEMQQNGNGNPAWTQIREVKIYDKFGVMRKQKQFGVGSQQVNIPVQDLPNDVYNVHVTNGVHTTIKQILIQR
jgi:Alpha/beta hydrolase of unknown function (DUF915)